MSRLVENDYEEEQEIDFEDRVVEDILEMLNRGDEEDDVAAIGMGRDDFGNEWREVDRRLQQGVQEQKEGDEEDGAYKEEDSESSESEFDVDSEEEEEEEKNDDENLEAIEGNIEQTKEQERQFEAQQLIWELGYHLKGNIIHAMRHGTLVADNAMENKGRLVHNNDMWGLIHLFGLSYGGDSTVPIFSLKPDCWNCIVSFLVPDWREIDKALFWECGGPMLDEYHYEDKPELHQAIRRKLQAWRSQWGMITQNQKPFLQPDIIYYRREATKVEGMYVGNNGTSQTETILLPQSVNKSFPVQDGAAGHESLDEVIRQDFFRAYINGRHAMRHMALHPINAVCLAALMDSFGVETNPALRAAHEQIGTASNKSMAILHFAGNVYDAYLSKTSVRDYANGWGCTFKTLGKQRRTDKTQCRVELLGIGVVPHMYNVGMTRQDENGNIYATYRDMFLTIRQDSVVPLPFTIAADGTIQYGPMDCFGGYWMDDVCHLNPFDLDRKISSGGSMVLQYIKRRPQCVVYINGLNGWRGDHATHLHVPMEDPIGTIRGYDRSGRTLNDEVAKGVNVVTRWGRKPLTALVHTLPLGSGLREISLRYPRLRQANAERVSAPEKMTRIMHVMNDVKSTLEKEIQYQGNLKFMFPYKCHSKVLSIWVLVNMICSGKTVQMHHDERLLDPLYDVTRRSHSLQSHIPSDQYSADLSAYDPASARHYLSCVRKLFTPIPWQCATEDENDTIETFFEWMVERYHRKVKSYVGPHLPSTDNMVVVWYKHHRWQARTDADLVIQEGIRRHHGVFSVFPRLVRPVKYGFVHAMRKVISLTMGTHTFAMKPFDSKTFYVDGKPFSCRQFQYLCKGLSNKPMSTLFDIPPSVSNVSLPRPTNPFAPWPVYCLPLCKTQDFHVFVRRFACIPGMYKNPTIHQQVTLLEKTLEWMDKKAFETWNQRKKSDKGLTDLLDFILEVKKQLCAPKRAADGATATERDAKKPKL